MRTSINTSSDQAKLKEYKLVEFLFPKPKCSTSVKKGVENIFELQRIVETFKHVSLSLAKELRNSKVKEEHLQKQLSVKHSTSKAQLKVELKSVKSELKSVKTYRDILITRLKRKSDATTDEGRLFHSGIVLGKNEFFKRAKSIVIF